MTDQGQFKQTGDSWSALTRLLHWSIAAIIIVQVVLAQLAKRAAASDETLERLALLANHKSLGLTVLLLVVVRIGWRLTHQPPSPAPDTPTWQRLASRLSHGGLYFLMLALPLSGWALAATSAYGLSWFNLFEVPRILAQNESRHELWEEAHEVLGYVLMAFVAVHVAAAAYHHLIVRDTVLRRMSSRSSIGLFIALLIGLPIVLSPDSNMPASLSAAAPAPATVRQTGTEKNDVDGVAAFDEVPLWNIDYERSFIRFTGEQAGAEFSGLWTRWTADMRFAPDRNVVRFDVRIDVEHANSDDDERDATLEDPDWFDVENHPVARFMLDEARRNADGTYTGTGTLTIKNRRTPTEFTFQVDSTDEYHRLTGSARLDRLELGVGTGEWADTSWVGQFVDVDVEVVARAADQE